MTVPALRLHAFDVPLESPFRIAYDTVTKVENTLCVAQAGATTGFGEAAPVKTITGEDRAALLAAWRTWGQGVKAPADARDPQSLRIASPALRTAVEGALLDVQARVAEQPLCTYLSGRQPKPVPTSITLGLVDDDKVAPWVARRRKEGFRILKVKAGLGAVANDLARIEQVRELAGPNVELRVDPNQAWSRTDTVAALPALRDANVAVLEQPLAKADLVGHAAVRLEARKHGIPLMLDESVFTAQDAAAAITAKACDAINIKLQKCGGLVPGLAIAAIAETAGVPCMVGCMVETRVGILQAAHLVLAHANITAADLDGHTFLAHDPVRGGAVVQDGALQVGSAAGLGIQGVAHGVQLGGAGAEPTTPRPVA